MAFSDLVAVLNRATVTHLGDTVTYTPGVGSAVDVPGAFDLVYVKIEAGQAGMSSQGPSVLFLTEDLPTDPVTDLDARVTFNGVTYRAHEVEPDGKGMVRLLLNEA